MTIHGASLLKSNASLGTQKIKLSPGTYNRNKSLCSSAIKNQLEVTVSYI